MKNKLIISGGVLTAFAAIGLMATASGIPMCLEILLAKLGQSAPPSVGNAKFAGLCFLLLSSGVAIGSWTYVNRSTQIDGVQIGYGFCLATAGALGAWVTLNVIQMFRVIALAAGVPRATELQEALALLENESFMVSVAFIVLLLPLAVATRRQVSGTSEAADSPPFLKILAVLLCSLLCFVIFASGVYVFMSATGAATIFTSQEQIRPSVLAARLSGILYGGLMSFASLAAIGILHMLLGCLRNNSDEPEFSKQS